MKARMRSMWLLGAAVISLGLVACSGDASTNNTPAETASVVDEDISHKISPEMMAEYYASIKAGEQTQAAVVYEASLCPDVEVSADVNGDFRDPDNFVYFKFEGKGGEEVTIRVDRTDCTLDPGMTFARGEATVTTGIRWSNQFFSSREIGYLTRNDDFRLPACTTACAEDPEITYTLPADDTYTIMVYSVSDDCGTDGTGFKIKVSGDGIIAGDNCVSDSDGDGIPDDEDDYPNSDTQATITIDGCSSGIDNEDLGDGAYMMDLINECAANANNHGQFVSCVSQLTNEWKAAGLISGNQKASITGCASSSSLP